MKLPNSHLAPIKIDILRGARYELSFTGTLNIVRRAVPKFQRLEPEEVPFFNLADSRNP